MVTASFSEGTCQGAIPRSSASCWWCRLWKVTRMLWLSLSSFPLSVLSAVVCTRPILKCCRPPLLTVLSLSVESGRMLKRIAHDYLCRWYEVWWPSVAVALPCLCPSSEVTCLGGILAEFFAWEHVHESTVSHQIPLAWTLHIFIRNVMKLLSRKPHTASLKMLYTITYRGVEAKCSRVSFHKSVVSQKVLAICGKSLLLHYLLLLLTIIFTLISSDNTTFEDIS